MVSRRQLVRWGGGGSIASAVLWFLFGDTDLRPLALSVALDPNVTDLSITDDELRLTITGESQADEWLFLHEYQEFDEAITTGQMPELGGEVTVPLAGLDHSQYPTDRFRFEMVSLVEREGQESLDIVRESGIEFSLTT
jgi:hypothetical protein